MGDIACYWPRAIIHIDMNAFFASVEQRDFPKLQGRPVGVTNGEAGSTLITCSYEARAFGIKTGMKIYEARKLCPAIIKRPSRPKVYAKVSTRIMLALETITPDIEVFSVDEAFLDITHCQRLHGSPQHIARMVQSLVYQVSHGLPCSVGVSGDKITAKYASDVKKPSGITVIPPWEARSRLRDVPVEKICGIGPAITRFLKLHNAHTCGDVAELPFTVLARRYGIVGKRIWLMCQGRDIDPLEQEIAPPKSVGHGKVLPPKTISKRTLLTYLRHMCEKVAGRLRRFDMQAGRLYIGMRCQDSGDMFETARRLPYGTPNGKEFFVLAEQFVNARWQGEAITHVQVTATHLKNSSGQLELFAPDDVLVAQRFRALDRINDKYGEFTVAPATILDRSEMPNVIAPAWRPTGHRQHIPD